MMEQLSLTAKLETASIIFVPKESDMGKALSLPSGCPWSNGGEKIQLQLRDVGTPGVLEIMAWSTSYERVNLPENWCGG